MSSSDQENGGLNIFIVLHICFLPGLASSFTYLCHFFLSSSVVSQHHNFFPSLLVTFSRIVVLLKGLHRKLLMSNKVLKISKKAA